MEAKTIIQKTDPLYSKNHMKKERQSLLLRRYFSNRLVVTGSVIILILSLISIFAPLITIYTPYDMIVTARLSPPSAEHFLEQITLAGIYLAGWFMVLGYQ